MSVIKRIIGIIMAVILAVAIILLMIFSVGIKGTAIIVLSWAVLAFWIATIVWLLES